MIFIALGSNLPSRYGSPYETLRAAMSQIDALGLRVIARSSIWETVPVPASDQPNYANAVIAIKTLLKPDALLQLLNALETDFGRFRGDERNAARILDLDILAFGEQIVEEDGLQIPHPRMQGRGFVLYPLAEIAPDWVHPVLKISAIDMIATLPDDQVLCSSTARAA